MGRISSHGSFRKLSLISFKDSDILTCERYHQSSSCAVRSSVSCYNLAHKFEFDAKLLKKGENEIVLSLPYNATNYESAVLPTSVYVQYDALRLEIE
jgi:rhamnogalacturonan endolyase